MGAQQHFQRLKHMYDASSASEVGGQVAISFGHAELNGTIDAASDESVVQRMSYQQLLNDVASLAAGTVEKEHYVTAEQFTVNVEDPDYQGSVVASAEIVMAEPPRYVVQAVLVNEEGDLVAEATGIFRPSDKSLPSDPELAEEEEGPTPPPATFMPVFTTPFGRVCLN